MDLQSGPSFTCLNKALHRNRRLLGVLDAIHLPYELAQGDYIPHVITALNGGRGLVRYIGAHNHILPYLLPSKSILPDFIELYQLLERFIGGDEAAFICVDKV